MKAVRSAVVEKETLGATLLVCGVVAGVTLPDHTTSWLPVAVLFAIFVFVLDLRRSSRSAVAAATELKDATREAVGATRRRALLLGLAISAADAALGVLIKADAVAGVLVGFGAAQLILAVVLRRWEQRAGRRLYVEPRGAFTAGGGVYYSLPSM